MVDKNFVTIVQFFNVIDFNVLVFTSLEIIN